MNVLILMAGEGKRFKDVGIETPKPFVEVNGKMILEWTTRSLPFIRHYNETGDFLPSQCLYFAIRDDQEEFGMSERLKEIYGPDINIISFKKTTEGSLETAYICATLMQEDLPLLVLDSDNKYDNNDLLSTIAEANEFSDSMVVSYFDPMDDSSKWSFVFSDGAVVTEIVEKDPTALQRGGRPLIGNFWFSSTKLFLTYSRFLISNRWKTGTLGKEEFYMSQVPTIHAKNKGVVFAHKVSNVVPLGTPEDVEKFSNSAKEKNA